MAGRSLIFTIGAELSPLEKALDQAAKKVQAFASRCGGLGRDLTSSVTDPIVSFGTAALTAARSYGDAMATIQRMTGATDEATKLFGESARRLWQEFPISMDEAAEAMGTVVREFGITGKAAEDMARAQINLSRVSGEGLIPTIKATDELFSRWGVSTADAAGWLQYLQRVSAVSGESVISLAQNVANNAGTFAALNIPLKNAIDMVGGFGTAGVDAGEMLGSLNRAVKESAENLSPSSKETAKWAQQQKDSASGVVSAREAVTLAQRRLTEAMAGQGAQSQEAIAAQQRYNQALVEAQQAHARLAAAQQQYAAVPSMSPLSSERARLYASALQGVKAASVEAAQADSALAKARAGLSAEMTQSSGRTNAVEAAQRALRDAQAKLSEEQRQGADASSKLAAAKKPVTDLSTAFSNIVDRIKNAPSMADAIRIASESGIRGAVEFAKAVRDGALGAGKDVGDSAAKLNATLAELEKKTRSWADNMRQFFKPVEDALRPVGDRLVKILKDLMPLFKEGVEWIGGLADRFGKLPVPVQESLVKMAALFALIGPGLVIFGELIGGLAGIVRGALLVKVMVGPTLAALWTAFTAGLGSCWSIIVGFGGILSGLGSWLLWLGGPIIAFGQWFLTLIGGPITLVIAALILLVAKWDWVKGWIVWIVKGICSAVGNAWDWLKENTRSIWSKIPEAIGYVLSNAGPLLKKATSGLGGILRAVWSGLLTVTKTIWNGIMSFISSTCGSIGSLVMKLAGGIAGALGKAFGAAGKLAGSSASMDLDPAHALGEILRSTDAVAGALDRVGRELVRLVGAPAGAVVSAIDTLSARMAAGGGGATINVSGGGGDSGLSGAFSQVASALGQIPTAIDTMVQQVTAQTGAIGVMTSALFSTVPSQIAAMNAIVVQLGRVVDKLVTQTLLLTGIDNTLLSLKDLMSGTVALPEVPQMASGGVVSRPTFAMVGEAGPEAIIPLSQLGGMAGTVVTVNVAGSVAAEWDIAQKIREQLYRQKRLNGSSDF